jgi:hypothetical protein
MCGCGQSAPIATYSSRKTGWLKGHPKQFIFGHGSPGREKIDRTKSPIEGSDYRVEDRGYKTPCWAWLRHLTKRGYPHVSTPNGPLCAHRWTYEMFVGPIPNGLEIDHLCRQPDCVNPDHLEPVTSPENMRRARAARAAGG